MSNKKGFKGSRGQACLPAGRDSSDRIILLEPLNSQTLFFGVISAT
ncbi:MAG: hypothetical protein V3R54_04425 [Thermodesulfovibrionia bacterium]